MGEHPNGVSATGYLETALAALRSLPEAAVMVFDRDLRFVVLAGQAAVRAGFAPEDVEGRLIQDVLSPERWLFWEPLYRAALHGESSSVEVEGVRIEGARAPWYHVEVSPWRGPDAAVAGGLSVAHEITAGERSRDRVDGVLEAAPAAMAVLDAGGAIVLGNARADDLTEQTRTKRELARARADIDRFFGLALDLMAIANADGYYVRVNPAFERTLGYSPKELTGRLFTDFIHPDDVQLTLDKYVVQTEGSSPVVGFENRDRGRGRARLRDGARCHRGEADRGGVALQSRAGVGCLASEVGVRREHES
jgi:PAS domain S-box-containing protein